MTKSKIAVLSLFAALALSLPAFGQVVLTNTTLSSALSSSDGQYVNVTSATGMTAPSASDPTKATSIYVDRELMDVVSVSGTTIRVNRAASHTAGRAHASGALVFVIPNYLVTFSDGAYGYPPAVPAGSCTRSNEVYLPRIQFISGLTSDCIGGQWVTGDALSTQRPSVPYLSPAIGATLQTAIDTAGNAAGASTEEYCTQINLPYSKLLTGLAVLNGTTVGTNKWLYILRDSSGIVLANTAVAGTLTAGASTYQQVAFTTPYYAVGPAIYFGCLQANGVTDTYRRVNTAANEGLFAGKITGGTFGTIVNPITPPASFTTALGGYWEFY
ncbi:MAG: hypothetical protein ACRD20_20485 [Terriglobales bacterium]